ncbi:MAG: hypothetical protein V1850_01650 [Candidatus Bathyarchaeota archaeon]
MEAKWIDTTIEIKTVNWKGEPLHLTGVKALKNTKTGATRVYPSEVAQAEVRQIAKCLDVLPRDVGSLLMVFAKPSYFKEGEVFYKYHLQKMLFYFWKGLDIF